MIATVFAWSMWIAMVCAEVTLLRIAMEIVEAFLCWTHALSVVGAGQLIWERIPAIAWVILEMCVECVGVKELSPPNVIAMGTC